MGYISPSLKELIERPAIIKRTYQTSKKKHNPNTMQLIDTLENIASMVHDAALSLTQQDTTRLSDLLLGAYIFCLESISSKYYVLNPNYTEGYFFNSGSRFYNLLLTHLDISESNKMDDIDKLNYLSKLHQVFFKDNNTLIKKHLQHGQLSFNLQEPQVRYIIQSLFNRVAPDAKKMIKAVPTESMIDKKMEKILTEYLAKASANNPERIFLAQLVEFATSSLQPRTEIKIINGKCQLPRTQRIKMGIFLYIILSIDDTYTMRSPRNHSVLYDLSCNALNIDNAHDFDDETKLSCLVAFDHFLADGNMLKQLEETVHQPVDLKIHHIHQQLHKMIEALISSKHPKLSSIAVSAAGIGALIMQSPSYGIGYAIGHGISQVNMLTDPKIALGKATGFVMNVFLGISGNYFSDCSANIIMNATLERAFGKLFEALGMLIGAAGGGAVGIIIYDLSYTTLTQLCSLYMFLYPSLSPNLINNADHRLIECFLMLPSEIFSEVKKDKLRSITEVGLFQQKDDEAAVMTKLPAAFHF